MPLELSGTRVDLTLIRDPDSLIRADSRTDSELYVLLTATSLTSDGIPDLSEVRFFWILLMLSLVVVPTRYQAAFGNSCS